jgi:mono/diheme cytochrome c family protein
VADEDERAIRAVDLDERQPLSLTRLRSRPGQILLSADGRLVVTLRDEARLAVFRATDAPSLPLQRVADARTAAEPLALAETTDGALLVASGWGHALEVFRSMTLEKTMTVSLEREPRAVATSRDGATAFVSYAAASQVTAVDLGPAGRKAKAIDLSVFESLTPFAMHPKKAGPMTGPLTMLKVGDARSAFALARFDDGARERIFVTHALVAPGEGFATGYGSTGFTQALGIDAVDPRKGALAIAPRSGDLAANAGGKGACLLPSAAAIDVRRKRLLVACRGPDEVRAYDATSDHPTWGGVKERWSVPAGASGIAVDEGRREAIVWSAFDGVLTVLPLDASSQAPTRIALDRTTPLPADAALGRRVFFSAGDPRIAQDGRACASCHIDGRDDGLVWSSPKGPRQTMWLAGRVDHPPPFGWLGEHASLPVHLAQTIRNLKGTGLGEPEVNGLVAWLKVMPGPPAGGSETETAEEARGREIFEGSVANCSSCHVPRAGAFRDQMTHDVGSGAEFLTPSLRFAGGSAPYFHDGRYATLEAMLRDPHGRMSDARKLPAEDLRALASYVRTL